MAICGILRHSGSLLKYTYSEVIRLLSIWYHGGAFIVLHTKNVLNLGAKGNQHNLSRKHPVLAQHWSRTGPKMHKFVPAQYRPNSEPVPVQYRPNVEPVPVQYRTSTDPRYLSKPIPIQYQSNTGTNVEPVLAQRRTNKFDVGPAPVRHWPVKVNHLGTHYLYCI